MNEYTLGAPWSVLTGRRNYPTVVEDDNGYCVADCLEGLDCEDEVPKAIDRARLIAASPDLLDALRNMLAAAKCGYDPAVALREYGAAAEAAVRRATGD